MGGGGKREIIYLSIHCHHQNDSCIKMSSDENQFNVSLIVRDKVTRHCPQTTTFEEKGDPKRIRTEVPLLNVSVGSNGQSHKTVPQTTTFLMRKESRSGIEPKSFRFPAGPNRLTHSS